MKSRIENVAEAPAFRLSSCKCERDDVTALASWPFVSRAKLPQAAFDETSTRPSEQLHNAPVSLFHRLSSHRRPHHPSQAAEMDFSDILYVVVVSRHTAELAVYPSD